MPVFARLAVLIVAAGLIGAPTSSAYAQEYEKTLKHIQKVMQNALTDTGKMFDEAVQRVKEAKRRHALKSAGYNKNKNLPFYVPDAKPAKKPATKPLEVPVKRKKRVVKKRPKKKPVIASPKVKATQSALNELGFDAGKPDGIAGRKTAQAIQRYQELIYHPVTGKLTGEERKMLLAAAQKKRQLAAVQNSEPGKGAMSYTVINKTPSGLPRSPQATPRKDKELVTGSTSIAKKQANAPESLPRRQKAVPLPSGEAGEDAKSALPSLGDENSFDADDPEG